MRTSHLLTSPRTDTWARLRDLRWGRHRSLPGVDLLQPDPTGTNRRIAFLTLHLDPYTRAEREAIRNEGIPVGLPAL